MALSDIARVDGCALVYDSSRCMRVVHFFCISYNPQREGIWIPTHEIPADCVVRYYRSLSTDLQSCIRTFIQLEANRPFVCNECAEPKTILVPSPSTYGYTNRPQDPRPLVFTWDEQLVVSVPRQHYETYITIEVSKTLPAIVQSMKQLLLTAPRPKPKRKQFD